MKKSEHHYVVELVNIYDNTTTHTLGRHYEQPVVYFDDKEAYIATACRRLIKVWDAKSGICLHVFPTEENKFLDTIFVGFGKSGYLYVWIQSLHMFRVYNILTGDLEDFELPIPSSPVAGHLPGYLLPRLPYMSSDSFLIGEEYMPCLSYKIRSEYQLIVAKLAPDQLAPRGNWQAYRTPICNK